MAGRVRGQKLPRVLGPKYLSTVSRKGQVTIPARLRKKYGIRKGMKMEVIDEPKGLVFRPVPHMNDWAGADAGKYSYFEMTQKLDRLRKKSR